MPWRDRRRLASLPCVLVVALTLFPHPAKARSPRWRAPASARMPLAPPLPPPRPMVASPAEPPVPVPGPPTTAPPSQNPPSQPAPHPAPLPGQAQMPGAAEASTPAPTRTCLARLQDQRVAAEATTIAAQPDPRCTVLEPVRLSGLRLADGSSVTFPDRPTIACATAETFSAYVRDLLAPLAKGSYGLALDAVWTGPGLECRTRDHIAGAKLSAHGQGLAIDIAQLRLGGGRLIEVGQPHGDLDKAFESAAMAAGCGYFHTALGPGADAFHETHWHFDLLARGSKGNSKVCEGS